MWIGLCKTIGLKWNICFPYNHCSKVVRTLVILLFGRERWTTRSELSWICMVQRAHTVDVIQYRVMLFGILFETFLKRHFEVFFKYWLRKKLKSTPNQHIMRDKNVIFIVNVKTFFSSLYFTPIYELWLVQIDQHLFHLSMISGLSFVNNKKN